MASFGSESCSEGRKLNNNMGQSFLEEKYWKSSKKSSEAYFRNSSSGRSSFTRRCSSLVKEQRAKFYIMRRCVTMLLCWHKYGDA
eukprot:Gb_00525 [translate_table: standard]